jgi:chemotaxis protein methyltransferase WspC
MLRLLSVPCASGEEPYSMSMALLDSAFPANRYSIDAVDVSTQVLAQARGGEYGKKSFRGADLSFRDRHCKPTEHGYRVSDAVCHPVRFHQGNLLAAEFVPGTEIYDIIFCRNLLIYFEREAREHAIGVLWRLLTAKGVLFVGPSEAGLLLSHGFMSTKVPLAFAFRKAEAVEHRTLPVSEVCPEARARQQRSAPPVAAPDCSAPGPRRFVEVPSEAPANLSAGIEQAALLADQGRLVEAARFCEEHLRKHGPSPEAFHLMGLVRAAAGNLAEAAEYYRKTLYLDPHHSQSLIHLALLLEEQGDKAAAKVMSDRVRRLHQR